DLRRFFKGAIFSYRERSAQAQSRQRGNVGFLIVPEVAFESRECAVALVVMATHAGVGGHRTREAMAQRSARARDVPGGAVVRLTLAGHAVADVTRAATTGSMITRRTTGTQVPERGIVETGLEERQDGRAHFELGAVP